MKRFWWWLRSFFGGKPPLIRLTELVQKHGPDHPAVQDFVRQVAVKDPKFLDHAAVIIRVHRMGQHEQS